MIKAYGSSNSGNCWKVKQILQLTQTPFDWIEIRTGQGATQSPEFLALNPQGQVPVAILDGGEVITESNAILAHVAEGSRFLPAPGLARTRVFEWLFFEQYSHEPYVAVARSWIAYRGLKEKNAALLPEKWERGHKALGVMEKRLAQHPYLAGGSLSIADIALYAYTHVAHEGDFDMTPYPGIAAWLMRIAAEPGVASMEPAKKA